MVQSKGKNTLCFPKVYYGPIEDILEGHVGKFTLILPYTMLSTETYAH